MVLQTDPYRGISLKCHGGDVVVPFGGIKIMTQQPNLVLALFSFAGPPGLKDTRTSSLRALMCFTHTNGVINSTPPEENSDKLDIYLIAEA